MLRKLAAIFAVLLLSAGMIFTGCSEDSSTPTTPGGGSDTLTLEIMDVAEIIRAVTPPVYNAPQGFPATDSFEVWTQGDYPLLEMVFGDEEDQTLDRNIYEFEFFTGMFREHMLVDENGAIITGTYSGEIVREEPGGGDSTYHGTFLVSNLTGNTTVPANVQSIIGTSIDFDYLIEIAVDEIPNGQVKVGFKFDSTEQSMMVWLNNMGGEPDRSSSSLVYSTLDPRDSTFQFKGTSYGSDNYGTFSTSYIVSSEANGEFGYRSSWFWEEANPQPGTEDTMSYRGSIIGGGNKDVEFALKFRQFRPADSETADQYWSFDQVFGPNYSEGTGLISSYAAYVNESLIIDYDDITLEMIPNPWAP